MERGFGVHSFQFRVRYQETDQMGVVYHANYFVWFEMGRAELFRSSGFRYLDLEEAGFLTPVIKVNCNYLKPAFYDDLLSVETQLDKLTPVRLEFSYQIKRKTTLLATGETVHAIIDNNGKPQNLKKKAPELWSQLQQV